MYECGISTHFQSLLLRFIVNWDSKERRLAHHGDEVTVTTHLRRKASYLKVRSRVDSRNTYLQYIVQDPSS